MICSAIVDLISEMNLNDKGQVNLFVAVHYLEKGKKRFSKYLEYDWFSIIEYDANQPFVFREKVDYIIHGASNAYPEAIGKFPVETFSANVFGISEILRYAVKNNAKVLYISTSEVYGLHPDNSTPLGENMYGCIDFLNPRSSYSIGKQAAETLCASYLKEYGVPFIVVRPGHIYGPTASENDNRVASQFLFAAARNEPLVLKSEGIQIRSYCYCLDCAAAVLTILYKGIYGNAYNISNRDSVISIREMAEIIANYSQCKLVVDVPSDNEKANFNPMLNSSLDASKLYSLGWTHSFSRTEGFEHSVRILREIEA